MSYAVLKATVVSPLYNLSARFPVYYSNSTTIVSFPHSKRELSFENIQVMEFQPSCNIVFTPTFEVLKYNRVSVHVLLATPKKVYIVVFDGKNPLIMFVSKSAYKYIGGNTYAVAYSPEYPFLDIKIKPYDFFFHGNLMVLRFNAIDLIERLYEKGFRTVIYDNEIKIGGHKITANKELAIFTLSENSFVIQQAGNTFLKFDHEEHGKLFYSTRKPAYILLHHPRTLD